MNMRTVISSTALALSALALSATAPAATGDAASALQGNIRAALRSAKSFVLTLNVKPATYAPSGGTMVYTSVAPNRYRQTITGMQGGDDDTIVIGNKVYGHDNGAWDVQTWSDHLVSGYGNNVFGLIVISIGDDQTVDGKTVGTFVTKYPPDEQDAWQMTCTYDKQTYHPIACTGSAAGATWRFDDPATAIPTPANAKPAG